MNAMKESNHILKKQEQHSSGKPLVRSDAKSIQGNLSEDEALARALHQSMIDTNKRDGNQGNVNVSSRSSSKTTQEREDEMLAQAIAESQRETRRNKDNCVVC